MKLQSLADMYLTRLLSKRAKHVTESVIVSVAILSFFTHLLLIFLAKMHFVSFADSSRLLTDPISAIYTPFSFILIYEVYLLIYYLPKSTSTYIGKQYEIITLILIRRIFKDLSHLKLDGDAFQSAEGRQFFWNVLATTVLFFLIFLFYRFNQRKFINGNVQPEKESAVSQFIRIKTLIAGSLIPVFIVLGTFSFVNWFYKDILTFTPTEISLTDLNKIFFDEFFTILILTDVLLLLISFIQSDRFHKVIRNSGFVVSTVLIKLSFSVSGSLNPILLIGAVLFGVVILKIHNLFEGLVFPEEN